MDRDKAIRAAKLTAKRMNKKRAGFNQGGNPNSIMNLDPKAFMAALDELGIQGEERNRLVGMYRDQTATGKIASALRGDVGDGMTRRNVLPIATPQGVSGAEALMSGDFEWAVPGMISSVYQAPADAIEAYDAASSGLPVSEEELNQKMMDMGFAIAGSKVIARPAAEAIDAAQRAQYKRFMDANTPSQRLEAFKGRQLYEPTHNEAALMQYDPMTLEQIAYWQSLVDSDKLLQRGASAQEAADITGILRIPRVSMEGDILGTPREPRMVTPDEMAALRPDRANNYGIPVRNDVRPDQGTNLAFFDDRPGQQEIWVNPLSSPEHQAMARDHEMIHADQWRSRVPSEERGTNVEDAADYRLQSLNSLAKRISAESDPIEKSRLSEQFRNLRGSSSDELYSRNPGELYADAAIGNWMAKRLTPLESLNPYLNKDKGLINRALDATAQAALGETTPWMSYLERKGFRGFSDRGAHAPVPLDVSKAVIGMPPIAKNAGGSVGYSTGGALELARAVMAKDRAGGQIAPSKYLPNVPRAVHADGGRENGKAAFMQGNHPLVPDVLYHGNFPKIATKGWTDEVDEEQTQKIRDAQDFRTFKPSNYGNFGPGVYLSDSPTVASNFAQGIRGEQAEALPHGQVFKLHVSMKNPFTDNALRHPAWKDYIKNEIKNALWLNPTNSNNAKESSEQLFQKLDNDTATVRDLFLRDTPDGTMVNQFGQDKIHKTIRNSGFDGIIAHRPDGTKEYVAFKPEQVKSAIGNSGNFDPTDPDITKGNGGKVEGKRDFTQDNPGGEWLENKQARASQYPDRKFVAGAITGVIGGRSSMFLPTHILKGIAGMNDETRTAGVHKYDSLLSDAQEGGFDHDQKGNKVVVAVNHYGQPYLLEGNTRVAVAHTLGIPKIKAEVRYWNGAENVDGPMHPDQVFGMASDSPDVTKSDGGEVVNLGKEKLVRSITKAASDVKSGAHQERMDQRAYKLHESGRLPLPIGTKVTPPQGWNMPSQLHIHGYWQDILNPDQHGYKLKSEDGDLYEVQHHTHLGQNPYIFGGGFKAYSGPVRNRAEYSDEAMASKNPAPSTKTPEQSSQINAEYDQLFGTDLDITKADGGRTGYADGGRENGGDGIVVYQGRSKKGIKSFFNPSGQSWGTTQIGTANQFAGENESFYPRATPRRMETSYNGEVHRLRFNIKNPMRVSIKDTMWDAGKERDKIEEAKSKGHDGLEIYHNPEKSDFVAFNPDQVEHLDSHTPDTRSENYQTGGAVTDTDEFRNWFGNSVTHTDGEPHVFYTGTSKDKDFTSHNVGRHGAWFVRDPEAASSYAEQNDSQGYKREGFKLTPTNTASRVIPAYVKAENPYTGELPEEYLRDNYKAAQSEWFDTLRAKGHDSWIPASQSGNLVVALKEPQQIKSIFNNGKFDPNQKHMNKAGGGEVDNNVTDLSTVRTMRDINSGDHSYGAQNMFADLAEKYAASQKAFDMAHASGAFDNFQMGDMFKYNGLPNYDPEKIVGFTVKHVSSSPNMTKLFNNHYPALEFETQDADRKVTTVPLEWFENNLHKYDKVGGKPKLVKADGGSVNKALALTRGFTKDGKSAITALKPKRK